MRLRRPLAVLCLIVLVCAASPSADPADIVWDTIATHPGMYDPDGTPEGECVGLAVSNHGEMGYAAEGGVNLDYRESGLECGTRPEDAIYLYSGSPFVILADDSYGTNARLTCSYDQVDDAKPYSWVPAGEAGSMFSPIFGCPYHFRGVPIGKLVSSDGAIAIERFISPAGGFGGNFIAVVTKLYSADGQDHNHLTVGSVMDWNIPSDSTNINAVGEAFDYFGASDPWGEPDRFLYMQGTDTTFSEACQSNTGRFGAEVFGGMGSESGIFGGYEWSFDDHWGYLAATQKLLRDTNLARDGITVIDPPQPDAGAWWDDIGANPGVHGNATVEDQAIWLTYLHDFSLPGNVTLWFWTVQVTARDGTLLDLEYAVDHAQIWFYPVIADYYHDCAYCRTGDANGQGGDQPTIGDVTVLIDAKFITGKCVVDEGTPLERRIIACLGEGDINRSGGVNPTCADITISDIAMLIDYLFISGPSLELPLIGY